MRSLLILPALLAACINPTEEKPVGTPNTTPEPTPEDTDTGSGTSTPVATPRLEWVDSVVIDGTPITLFNCQGQPCTITQLGSQSFIQRFSTDGTLERTTELEASSDRSYGWADTITLGNESYSALTYTSSGAFQDGNREQGVVILDSSDSLVADHNFGDQGLDETGPSAFSVLTNGGLAVLNHNFFNSTAPEDIIDFGDSSAVVIDDALSESTEVDVFTFLGYKNAGAMTQRDGALLVAAANNTMDETASGSVLLSVDLEDGAVTEVGDLPLGVGLNGNAHTSSDGRAVFTGANKDGRSIVVVDDSEVKEFSVPNGIATGAYVSSAQFAGDSLVFSTLHNNWATTLQLALADGSTRTLNEVPATGAISPILIGGLYYDVAVGTAISDDGSVLYSDINMYEPVYE